MGQTLNSVERLGEPFLSIDEQVFVVPETGSNEVINGHFKLVVMLHGACQLEIDQGGCFNFEPGDILIVPHRCRYQYRPAPGGKLKRVHALRLLLDPAVAPALAGEQAGVDRLDDKDDETSLAALVRRHLTSAAIVPRQRNARIRAVLAELRMETEQQQPGRHFQVTALCTLVLMHVIRQFVVPSSPVAPTRQQGRARLINVAKEYLTKNLAAPLRLVEIARHLDVSPEHLARVFKQETGLTVFEQLEQIRIEQAKTYLLSSDLSVAEIATQTGFSSTSLFSRNFKRCVGASPLRYRQDRWREAASSRAPGLEPSLE